MKAFEVHLNGKNLCIAGLVGNGVLSVIMDYVSGHGSDEAALSVGGLISSTQEHVRWAERTRLKTGDEILVKVIEAETADMPQRRFSRDPAVELKHQQEYVREMAKKLGWTVNTKRSRVVKGNKE